MRKVFVLRLIVVALFASLFGSFAGAQEGTNHGGGGGTTISGEFELMAQAIKNYAADYSNYGVGEDSIFGVKTVRVEAVLKRLRTRVSPVPLYVMVQGRRHFVEAKNYPATGLVEIYETAWLRKKTTDEKVILVIHEILGLLRIPDPGYTKSNVVFGKLRKNLLLKKIGSFDRVLLIEGVNEIRRVSCVFYDSKGPKDPKTDEVIPFKFESPLDTREGFSGPGSFGGPNLISHGEYAFRAYVGKAKYQNVTVEVYRSLGQGYVDSVAKSSIDLFGEARKFSLELPELSLSCEID